MSIPHFKSNHDWEAFTQIFDSQWHCKQAQDTYGNYADFIICNPQ
jgi:hypothetical protein